MGRTEDDNETRHISENLFQNLTNFVDENLREIRYASYGLAAVGGILILRSTFALKKFRHAKDIPELYIRTHAKLQGKVKAVAPPGVLHVDHIPVIALQKLHKQGDGNLTVQLAGIRVLPPGETWLRQNLANKPVWFKVLSLHSDGNLDCEVTAKKGFLRNMRVNQELVGQGLAKLLPNECLPYNEVYTGLARRLIKAEMYAQKKGLGAWSRPSLKDRVIAVPTNIKHNIKASVENKVSRIKGIFSWLPEMRLLRKKTSTNSSKASLDENVRQPTSNQEVYCSAQTVEKSTGNPQANYKRNNQRNMDLQKSHQINRTQD